MKRTNLNTVKNLVVLLLTGLTTFAQAQVNHVGFNPYKEVPLNGEIVIDLNNDGITDLILANELTFQGPVITISGSTDCFYGVYNDYVDTLPLGDTVTGNSLTFSNATAVFANYLNENLFFGFKLRVNADTYYGWMRYTSGENEVHLKDYCINTISEEYIIVGDFIPQAVENIEIKDINAYFDGRAMMVSCSHPFHEENIIEHRGFVLKNSILSSFNVEYAKGNTNYFASYNTLTLPEIMILDEQTTDCEGNLITNLTDYNCVFLSLVENASDTLYYLSGFSNTLMLTEPLESVLSLSLLDVSDNNNSSDISLTFSPWNQNSGIHEYRLFFAERNNHDTLSMEELLSSQNYYSVALNDTNNYILPATLKDIDNQLIAEELLYDVYLLSTPNYTTHDVAAFKMMDWSFMLKNPAVFYPANTNYAGFQYHTVPETILQGSNTSIDHPVDINNDGINDIELKYNHLQMGGVNTFYLGVSPFNDNEILLGNNVVVDGSHQYNSALNWTNSLQYIYYAYASGPYFGVTNAGSSNTERYLPFRVYTSTDTLIGFIELSPYNELPAVTIHGFGYYRKNASSIEVLTGPSVNIYPNPARELISIETGSNQPATVKMINSSGKNVFQQAFTNKLVMNVQGFAKGPYLLQIQGSKSETRKIIIE